MNHKLIEDKFKELYGSSPLLVRSPGRINLIGEHTDYNDGFVLPAAIDKEMVLAVAKNDSETCRLYSLDFDEAIAFNLQDLQPSDKGWPNYILGVVDQLQKGGYQLGGFDCVFGGDIPIGAGLSSSAALECGAGYALSQLFGLKVEKQQLIRFAQKAEHTFAGVQCGIMDQFASVMGKEAHALRLDCRSLDFSYFPLELGAYQIVLLDTQVKHSLASSEYNTRRQECEQGVAKVKEKHPHVHSLRDVTLEMLDEVKSEISPVIYKRCRYVIEENDRLLKGCDLLEQGDIKAFGQKMYGSHEGLSEQYEVSCPELDFLVGLAKENAHVVGARMMGGGFGGCTINMVAASEKDSFIEEARQAYRQQFGIELKSYEVKVTDGTGQL
ncbi:galactokinase [Flammeovirgaceae bacterium 311]|nr:galactokinase [Flammeovirgaceae bacterium 311]